MNRFVLEIFDNDCQIVTYYSVRWEDAPLSETSRFFNFCISNSNLDDYTNELTSLLFEQIGNEYGAHEAFFVRSENKVKALPPAQARLSSISLAFHGNPLRLYCLRLSTTLVILFNGGEKKSQTVQQDPLLNMKFTEANQFAEAIENALREKYLKITDDGRTLYTDDWSEEILLP